MNGFNLRLTVILGGVIALSMVVAITGLPLWPLGLMFSAGTLVFFVLFVFATSFFVRRSDARQARRRGAVWAGRTMVDARDKCTPSVVTAALVDATLSPPVQWYFGGIGLPGTLYVLQDRLAWSPHRELVAGTPQSWELPWTQFTGWRREPRWTTWTGPPVNLSLDTNDGKLSLNVIADLKGLHTALDRVGLPRLDPSPRTY